jgi:hypothetical protein
MTLKQIESLKEFAALFNKTKQLYNVQLEPLTMMLYRYEKEITSFVEFCYENHLVRNDYKEISAEFEKNYQDAQWYAQLTEKQLLQCLSFCIRRDRFVDGFLGARIEDGSVNKVIETMVQNK